MKYELSDTAGKAKENPEVRVPGFIIHNNEEIVPFKEKFRLSAEEGPARGTAHELFAHFTADIIKNTKPVIR